MFMYFFGRMNISKLCASLALVLLVTSSTAQIPATRTENCGAIISSVISVCTHPTLARPDWCCNELKKWNDARCWCEPNAFDALETVTANGYAFSVRDDFCAEAFQRPVRGLILPEQATCEPFDSVADTDGMEMCADITPAELRTLRMATLDQLRDDRAVDEADLNYWFVRMDNIFTEETKYELVGLFLGEGRFEVKQYFMTRQELYGFEPIVAESTSEHFWRNPRMVSYKGGVTTAQGYFEKYEFVTFEPCTARIAALHTVDSNYQTRYAQFWNARETRLLLRYDQTAASWCAQVSERCSGDLFPFESSGDCVAYYSTLQAEGRITCNKFEQAYLPQYAIHGDTIACRSFYLDLAVVDPAGACAAVGKESNRGRCEESQCPGGSYIDPFARDATAPQYESVPAFECTETECDEVWPSEAQIASVPASELGARSIPVVTPTPMPTGTAEEGETQAAEDPALANDSDEAIDESFENSNVPPPPQPATAESVFQANPINA